MKKLILSILLITVSVPVFGQMNYQTEETKVIIQNSVKPHGGPKSPEMVHVFEKFTDVSGLIRPSRYHTYPIAMAKVSDVSAFGAVHEVTNWEVLSTFEEERMEKPEEALAVKDTFKKEAK